MIEAERLRKRLQILRRDRNDLMNVTPEEVKYFDLKEFQLEIQIEAQTFRDSVNSAFRLCRRWEKGEKLVSLFEWEALKDNALAAITEHENKILNRIEIKIRTHYVSDKSRTTETKNVAQ